MVGSAFRGILSYAEKKPILDRSRQSIVVNVYACYREFSGEEDRLPVPVLFGSVARYDNRRKDRPSFRNVG